MAQKPYTLQYDQIFAVVDYHYRALPHAPLIISEGANTMDICRELIDIRRPRGYVDAGTSFYACNGAFRSTRVVIGMLIPF